MTELELLQSIHDMLAGHLSWDLLWWGFGSGVSLGLTLLLWHTSKTIFDDTDRDL